MTLDLVNVGKVGRAHGLAGAFFVSDRSDPIPKSYAELFIGKDAASAVVCTILQSSMQGSRPLLRITLAADRTAAEGLTGQAIFAERRRIKARTQSPDDPFGLVWGDLEGLCVVDAAGVELGIVQGLYNSGAADVMIVAGAAGVIDLPLIEAYFDPATVAPGGKIRLKVGADMFDGLWQVPKGGAEPPVRPKPS